MIETALKADIDNNRFHKSLLLLKEANHESLNLHQQ